MLFCDVLPHTLRETGKNQLFQNFEIPDNTTISTPYTTQVIFIKPVYRTVTSHRQMYHISKSNLDLGERSYL